MPEADDEPLEATRAPRVPRSARASSARMPPSPLLSARMITARYLKAITHSIDQTSSERMPKTLACVRGMPLAGLKAVLSAYSGLVPMSPNTTPIAPITSRVVGWRYDA